VQLSASRPMTTVAVMSGTRPHLVAQGWLETAASAFGRQHDAEAERLERLLNYMCLSQLYLKANFRLDQPLTFDDLKPDPAGHWGVCPPTNHVLTAISPLLGVITAAGSRVRVLHGAGHAGPSLRAWSYLSGDLGLRHARYSPGTEGYQRIIAEFPGKLSGEITPLLPGVDYMGGQIGGALAFAQGVVLGAADLVIPLIGDGECETGETSSAWLTGWRQIAGKVAGIVLPVVLLNGFRMGSRSVLGRLSAEAVHGYFTGLGCTPLTADGSSMASTRQALLTAIRLLAQPGTERPPVVLLTMPKGATSPDAVGGRPLAGTSAVHKAPLRVRAGDDAVLRELDAWLRSYDPASLLDERLCPLAQVARVPAGRGMAGQAAQQVPVPGAAVRPVSAGISPTDPETGRDASAASGIASGPPTGTRGFREAMLDCLECRARDGGLLVFSPDEFSSNLGAPEPGGALEDALIEVLNEQVCHGWLDGYATAGGRGVFVGYEGFASLTATHMVQYAKKLRLLAQAGRVPPRSLNYLLSSTCWENSYSHQDPSIISLLLSQDSDLIQVFTPATVGQCLATLDRCLDDFGHLNVIVFSKRGAAPLSPLAPTQEREPWSVWPSSASAADSVVTIVAIGNVMLPEAQAAALLLRRSRPRVRTRLLSVNELAVLATQPGSTAFWRQFDESAAVIFVTSTQVAPIERSAGSGLAGKRFSVVGYRDQGEMLSGPALLRACRCDADSIAQLSLEMIARCE
jgi:xylulose-5-phosphate/fructose-6-phosphate phosphoketolase